VSGGGPLVVDRRVTLQWLAGAMAAAALPGCTTMREASADAAPAAGTSAWPQLEIAPVDAAGYGTDPNLMQAAVPWPKTLSPAQLETAAAICDTILPAEGSWPAPSAVGIQHFIDEWVSAPYSEQEGDRRLLLNGFAWVEAEATRLHGRRYASLDEAPRAAILAAAPKADAKGGEFLSRMKFLTTGAYYTSEQGIAELGYIGNEAISGDYPGPTAEALAHLDGVLARLNLTRKGKS
jgi:hypothetical protein